MQGDETPAARTVDGHSIPTFEYLDPSPHEFVLSTSEIDDTVGETSGIPSEKL